MDKYLISVIIPVYNAKDYIRECIDSVLNQSIKGIEIVLINDGSTDGTTEILREYQDKHSNITLIEKANEGVLAARHDGILNAHGELIGWVDADDFLDISMYQELYDLMIRENADYVYCDYNFYPEEIKSKAKWFKEWHGVMDWKFLERNTQCWKSLTKKELLDRINTADNYLRYGEYAWIEVLLNAKKIAYTNKCLYNYRVGHVSLSSANFEGRVQKFKSGVEQASHLKEILRGTKYESSLSAYFDYRYIYTLLQLEVVAAVNKDRTAYMEASRELERMHFRSNQYVKEILDFNHGKKKSFVLRNFIPASYSAAVLITKAVY